MFYSWPLRCLGLLLCIAGVFSQTVCPPVEGKPSCVCSFDNVTYISLLSFGGSPENPSLQISYQNFDYFLNPCYGVNLDVVSGSCASGDGMAGCQETTNKDSAWGLGELSTETIYKNTDDTYYVTYTNGQNTRHVKLNLVCIAGDQEDDLSTEGDEGHALEYVFTLKSHKVCPTASLPNSSSGKGNNAGAIGLGIISLAIVGILAYVIAGILINKFAFSKSGLDLIPQRNIWFTIPFLIKDGFMFVLSPMIRVVRKDYQPLA